MVVPEPSTMEEDIETSGELGLRDKIGHAFTKKHKPSSAERRAYTSGTSMAEKREPRRQRARETSQAVVTQSHEERFDQIGMRINNYNRWFLPAVHVGHEVIEYHPL